MKCFTIILLSSALLSISCTRMEKNVLFEKENLVAWCIVPFDAMDRSPSERAGMLNELGISQYAYDYRDRHISEFPEEIGIMKEAGINISAVWLWIQDADSSEFDPASERIIRIVEEQGLKTSFWLSFPGQFFEGLTGEEKFRKAVNKIRILNERLIKAGCSIALYNHGDWFGNPLNQIKIIEEIGSDNIGIVYNFHHAHHEIDNFPDLLPEMTPYLKTLNLNGMTKEGPKIITLGEGKLDAELIRVIVESDYHGPIGILGHTEGEDIKKVLQRNIEGLETLVKDLD